MQTWQEGGSVNRGDEKRVKAARNERASEEALARSKPAGSADNRRDV